jgi:hypothetical protein
MGDVFVPNHVQDPAVVRGVLGHEDGFEEQARTGLRVTARTARPLSGLARGALASLHIAEHETEQQPHCE